jgi:hypothetical protein
MMPAYYLMVIAVVGMATGLSMKETANRPLKGATLSTSHAARVGVRPAISTEMLKALARALKRMWVGNIAGSDEAITPIKQ